MCGQRLQVPAERPEIQRRIASWIWVGAEERTGMENEGPREGDGSEPVHESSRERFRTPHYRGSGRHVT